ncbi:ABC transporter permease [Bradyrhizobium neotropicale]|uniref:ABC transporter permease n=1 Tax=Bradyrhizobium neotropicale TaxID=1497615 RepID=UPI001AD7A71E|nr:ABC transporter permease [Bradyrhizobium neotropicale]MBO4223792.1 ABC transporter permease subunit [Bradyrhizobium neotropicale]
MIRFLLGRLLQAAPTMIIVSVAIFFLMRLIPGDPAAVMLGDLATPEQVEALRREMGLSGSLPTQYVTWLSHILAGDFGKSITSGDPVLPLMLDRFAVSATIVVTAVLLATLIAVPAGMFAAWRQGSLADYGLVATSTLLLSIPSFWLGLMILLVFGMWLEWFPVIGYVSLHDDFRQGLMFIFMPALTLILVEIGPIVRMARASTIEVSRLEYITHARAKGLSEAEVMWRHAFRNAFAPTWTLIGLILGGLLGGIAVTETVFTIPGLGRLLVEAIYARDYPVVQGCILFISVIYVVVNLIVDMLYPLFDPRIAQ